MWYICSAQDELLSLIHLQHLFKICAPNAKQTSKIIDKNCARIVLEQLE